MLRIQCPCCGLRDHDEFRYGGDASVQRPSLDETNAEDGYRYVFIRTNPKSRHFEYWQHVMGCRRWLIVERSTATHDIASVVFAKDRR